MEIRCWVTNNCIYIYMYIYIYLTSMKSVNYDLIRIATIKERRTT